MAVVSPNLARSSTCGVELNVVQKSGSWFSYNGNKLGQGRDAVKQLIEDNPELLEDLEKAIKAKLAGEEGRRHWKRRRRRSSEMRTMLATLVIYEQPFCAICLGINPR